LEPGDGRRPRRARARAGLNRERGGDAGAEVELDHHVLRCRQGGDEPDAVELAARLVADPEAVEHRVPLVGGDGSELRGLLGREADGSELVHVAAVADDLDVDADLVPGHREDAQLPGVAEVEVQPVDARLAVGAELDPRLGAEVRAEDLLDARDAGPEVDVVLRPRQTQRRSPPRAPAR
jgi:hypothetical protein